MNDSRYYSRRAVTCTDYKISHKFSAFKVKWKSQCTYICSSVSGADNNSGWSETSITHAIVTLRFKHSRYQSNWLCWHYVRRLNIEIRLTLMNWFDLHHLVDILNVFFLVSRVTLSSKSVYSLYTFQHSSSHRWRVTLKDVFYITRVQVI